MAIPLSIRSPIFMFKIIEGWSPDRKAKIITIGLIALTLVTNGLAPKNPAILLINGLLLFHTYFSIRCFSLLIRPVTAIQRSIDAGLIVLYVIILGWNLPLPEYLAVFEIFSLVATVKYITAQHEPRFNWIFQQKILVDLNAALVIVALLMMSRFRPAAEVLASGVILYSIGTVYFFTIRPLYPPPS